MSASRFKKGDRVLVRRRKPDRGEILSEYERKQFIVGEVVFGLINAPQAIVDIGPYKMGVWDIYIAPYDGDKPIGSTVGDRLPKIS